MTQGMTIQLRTLTPIWTGGVDQKPDRLHETGLIGSLRWWYEALVRGLGGYACDPTSSADRCPDLDGKHCVACELFGCTGWGRKFKLVVEDGEGKVIEKALERNMEFVLEFVELRSIAKEEMWLLAKTVEVAAKYGSIGGKTTLKPQANVRRPQDSLQRLPSAKPGDDMGIISWQKGPRLSADRSAAAGYVGKQGSKGPGELPDLRWFFFMKGSLLRRGQMNTLMGRSPDGRSVIRKGPIEDALR